MNQILVKLFGIVKVTIISINVCKLVKVICQTGAFDDNISIDAVCEVILTQICTNIVNMLQMLP